MARLWVMSDLHLEAVRHPEAFRPARPDFDVLVVAGDVWEGDTDAALRMVARLAGGKPAVFVLGNHEFWNREVRQEREAARCGAAKHGVTLLDDDAVELAGVRFVGGTLWADGKLAGADAAPGRPTGERITVGRGRGAQPITSRDEATLHGHTRALIRKAIWDLDGQRPLVVVTHHAPHPLCLPEAHRTGWAAGNAASDLSYLTDAGRIDLWVHGHVHHSVNQTFRHTPVVCNPAGPGFSNPAFQDDLVVEVRTWSEEALSEEKFWWQVPLPTLETARLTLRPFIEEDEAALAAMYAKLEMVRYFQPNSDRIVRRAAKEARGFCQRWTWGGQEGRLVPFAVVERASGRLVGSTGVCIHENLKVPALSVFVDSSVWGRGYAAEAAAAALSFSFEKHAFGEVVATVMVENAASHRVIRKLGFEVTDAPEDWDGGMTLYRLTPKLWQNRDRRSSNPSVQ